MTKKLRVRDKDGAALVVDSEPSVKVSDDLEADSSGDRSVWSTSCDGMLVKRATTQCILEKQITDQIEAAIPLHC